MRCLFLSEIDFLVSLRPVLDDRMPFPLHLADIQGDSCKRSISERRRSQAVSPALLGMLPSRICHCGCILFYLGISAAARMEGHNRSRRFDCLFDSGRPRPDLPQCSHVSWLETDFREPLIGCADLALQKYDDEPHILDLFSASYLSDRGQVRFDALLTQLDSGKMRAVITETPLETVYHGVFVWPHPIRRAIEKEFRRREKPEHGYIVYSRREQSHD